ncbi:alcohol acetyltransferase [Ganoderma leucocontextum]|nr:alcohol acetyltransferase [Ganoderma leucocontextum]
MPDPPACSDGMRKPGHIEQYFNVYSRIGFCGWVVVAGRYETPSGAPLGVGDKATLFAALEQVVRCHAALHSRLPPPSEPQDWRRLSSIDLNELVQFLDKDGSGLRASMEGLFARDMDFPEDKPRWKVIVLCDGTIVFVWDHAIGDGQSGLAFHHALLSALNRICFDPPPEHSGVITNLPPDVALPPSLEDAAGRQMSVPFPMVVRVLAEEYLPFIFARKHAAAWTGNPVPTTIIPATHVRILHYSPSETSELLRVSREHNTTLTGTLHTLALVVLARLIRALPDGDGTKYQTIASFLPISMRRHTRAPPTAICVHVSHYEGHHAMFPPDIDLDRFPWDAAAAFTGTLKRAAARAGPITAMMKYLFGRYEEYFRGHLGKKRGAGLAISNLGAFPEPSTAEVGEDEREGWDAPQARWRIREMTFAQADATLGAALKLNVVGSPDGGLGVTVTWGTSAVHGDLAEAFVAALDDGLRVLVASAQAP